MAMINCPECNTPVSDKAAKCPSCGVQLRKPKRGFFGKLIKWNFILFNLLTPVILAVYFSRVGEMTQFAGTEAERTGAMVGGVLGTGVILTIWMGGFLLLGAMVLMTRPKQL